MATMSGCASMETDGMSAELWKQGAEAKIYHGTFLGKPCIIKERFSKAYRHPTLDKSLTVQRTRSEVRSIMRCRMCGIATPAIYFVDLESHKIYMEHLVDAVTVKDHIAQVQGAKQDLASLHPLAEKIGTTLGIMHHNNIIHGDLTTSNLLLRNASDICDIVIIDFGLGSIESLPEDKGVDLYVLERALLSTHPNTETLFEVILKAYEKSYGKGAQNVVAKFEEVRLRGRKRTMVG